MSLLSRLRAGLRRTAAQFTDRLAALTVEGEAPLDAASNGDTLAALEELLIEADVGIVAAERIVSRVRDGNGAGATLTTRVKQEILEILDRPGVPAAAPTRPML